MGETLPIDGLKNVDAPTGVTTMSDMALTDVWYEER
jgi:hypothetical protein